MFDLELGKDSATILYLEEMLQSAKEGKIQGMISYVDGESGKYLVYTGSMHREKEELLDGIDEIRQKLKDQIR